MGCCVSKCRPNKHSFQHHLQLNQHVHQDKLVMSHQNPQPPIIPRCPKYKISPSPLSPPTSSSSTSSISSFIARTNNISSTTSSLSSTASSSSALTTSSKVDRSFSNEFLWSCYKDNPHIIRINSLREATLSLLPAKPKPHDHQPPRKTINSPMKVSPAQNVVGSFSMPQKRVRSNSPINLTRQKSFRKELLQPAERTICSAASRTLVGSYSSPSPSRRFNGDNYTSSVSKRMVSNSPKVSNSVGISPSSSRSVSPSMKKESVKKVITSPNNSSRRLHSSGLGNIRETCTYRGVGSKIDETVVKDVEMNDSDLVMENIDNPLISLDCFIFL